MVRKRLFFRRPKRQKPRQAAGMLNRPNGQPQGAIAGGNLQDKHREQQIPTGRSASFQTRRARAGDTRSTDEGAFTAMIHALSTLPNTPPRRGAFQTAQSSSSFERQPPSRAGKHPSGGVFEAMAFPLSQKWSPPEYAHAQRLVFQQQQPKKDACYNPIASSQRASSPLVRRHCFELLEKGLQQSCQDQLEDVEQQVCARTAGKGKLETAKLKQNGFDARDFGTETRSIVDYHDGRANLDSAQQKQDENEAEVNTEETAIATATTPLIPCAHCA